MVKTNAIRNCQIGQETTRKLSLLSLILLSIKFIKLRDFFSINTKRAVKISADTLVLRTHDYRYEGGSICNENPFITPYTNALGLYAICQTKDQSIAVIMVQETLFYLSNFFKLQTF